MFTPTVNNMTPEDVMRKKPFTRIVPATDLTPYGHGFKEETAPEYHDGTLTYVSPTQADFMREFDQNAHKINSEAYYPNPMSQDKETGQWYVRKLARVTVNLPEIFANQRTSMLTGNETDIKLIGGGTSQAMQDRLSSFMEGWAWHDMEVAKYDLIFNNAVVGDAAIVFYLENAKLGWRKLSYMEGDVLYPHYDFYGNLAVFGRKYSVYEKGDKVTYLDVYDKTMYVRYKFDMTKEKNGKWVMDESAPHGFPRVPVAYYRYGEPFWSGAMCDVDQIELALSQLCENNRQYALRILYALGGEMHVKATMDGRPMQINSPDANARVGFLEPADSSGSFELQLRQLIKHAYQAAHCVEAPEVKSGADMSSLTVQMLYADVYHKSLNDAKVFQKAVNDIIELFQWGWGIETGKPSDYDLSVFRVKGFIHPYIMKSENEEVNNISILANSGGLPKKAVANESYKLGYGTPRNYEDVRQEEHDALVSEQKAAQEAVKNNTVAASRSAEQ